MSEWCERTSERTSEWPSTYVSILVCSRPQCGGAAVEGRAGPTEGATTGRAFGQGALRALTTTEEIRTRNLWGGLRDMLNFMI